jgi:steroid Delta-isomerase
MSRSGPGDPRMVRIVQFFEQLSPSDLPRFGEYYVAEARFKDPFNDVQGVPAIAAVFEHMFRSVEAPRFVVHEVISDRAQSFLTWDFLFRLKRAAPASEQVIRGATHLHLAEDGRILKHRDYWDPAEELYEKLPAVGLLLRWLKRRARR